MSMILPTVLLLAFMGLVFWQRHVFLYILATPVCVVYGLIMASNATEMYNTTWVIGIVVAIMGIFCLFRASMKLFNRE